MDGRGDKVTDWRSQLRRDVTLLLALKVAALALLWVLFFAPREHVSVDGPRASRHLGLADGQVEARPDAIRPALRAPEKSP